MQAFATANGAAAKYHETLTVAWMAIVAERLASTPDLDWDAFAATHTELFARPSLVHRYYADDLLKSDRAKRVFILPTTVNVA